VPKRFATSITEGNLTVNCDVSIELPETGKLPMARVEAGRFSQEQVYTLFKALCGDTPMYLLSEQKDKAYYEKMIMEGQQILAGETDKDFIESMKETIADAEEKYKTAPEHIELKPADGTLETEKLNDDTNTVSGSFTGFYASAAPLEGNAMTFSVKNDPEYEKDDVYTYIDEDGTTVIIAPRSWSQLKFQREGMDTDYGLGRQGSKLKDVTGLSLSGGAADGCILSTTPQQARKTVEAFLKETGINDMVIDSVSLYTNKQILPPEVIEDMKQQGGYSEDTTPEAHAYVFRFLRKAGGAKVESAGTWSSQSSVEGMDVGKEWDYEIMEIAVDDKGITNLFWQAPLDVKEIMTEDTAIRPWNEIEEIFGKMMIIQYADYINTYDFTYTIDITRASLTLRRIMERDSYTIGLLVPVWNFFGWYVAERRRRPACRRRRR
jgi:hypothetical protein